MFGTLKKSTVIFAILLITNTFISTSTNASDEVVKSQYDSKDYLSFTLANQLEVLVISQPKSDVAAASLVVSAGHRNAPDNYQGLPHLLEHAVLLGSKSFPDVSEFDTFIKSHRGWSNGSTASDGTRYHFQLAHHALDEGLQRLADFIAFPLLQEKSIAKSLTAVDNEYQGRTDDWRKILAILQQESNPKHPSSKFGTGNYTTLGSNLTQLKSELVNFHQSYYGAQNMTLVVYGKEPVAVLKNMVIKYFSQIIKSNLSGEKSIEPLHLPEQLASQIELNVQSDMSGLDIRFEVPPSHHNFPKNTQLLVDYVLGQEAEGSLYAYLKERGLINKLQTSISDNRYYGIFALYIQLTDKGLANTDKVIESVFAYINLLKTQPLPSWISADRQIIAQRAFDFPPEEEPGDWLSDISFNMHLYPKENWLNHNTLITTNDFNAYLAQLTPEKMQLVISRKKVKTNKVEAIYGTPYRIGAFSKTQLSLWRQAKVDKTMFYPAKNPYFSVKKININQQETPVLSVKSKKKQAIHTPPKLVVNTAEFRLWSQQKSGISVDKVSTKLRLYDELMQTNSLVKKVRSKVLQNYLADTSFFAYSAGFDFKIDSFSSGYTIEVNGYSDKYFDFLQRITEVFFQYETTEQTFNLAKQALLNDIDYRKNSYRPYRQVQRAIFQELVGQESDDVIAKQLAILSYQDYLSALAASNKFQLSGLTTGNVNDKKLVIFSDKLHAKFKNKFSSGLIQSPKVKQLAKAQHKRQVNIDHSDASIALVIQAHDDSMDNQVKFFLANTILHRKYYHSIRTDKSLAYFVHMRQLPTYNSANMVMVAQSGNSSAEQLTQASNDFLTDYAQVLKAMSAGEFKQWLDDAINTLNAPIFSLNNYTWKLEQELYASKLPTHEVMVEPIQENMVPFSKKQQLVSLLNSMTKKDFELFYHQQIIGEHSKRLLLFSPKEP